MRNIDINEFREPYKSIAEVIGVETMIKLSENFPRFTLYIPTISGLLKQATYKNIIEEYNGANVKQLALRYGVSERTIYRILESKLNLENKLNSTEFKNHISLF